MHRYFLKTSFAALLAVTACGGKQSGEETLSNKEGSATASEKAGARAATQPIPSGYFTITPGLMVEDADAAISFYTEAFGASTLFKIPGADGKTEHAELKIGDSKLMISRYHQGPESGSLKPPKTLGGTPGSLNYYVEDVDAVVKRALSSGAQLLMPVENQFWGDRWGLVQDPFGHVWGIGTAKVVLTGEQIRALAPIAMAPGAQSKIEAAWKTAAKADGYKQKDYHDITPSLHLKGGTSSLDFYRSGLGGQQRETIAMPNGKLMHAEVKIGDSIVMADDEMPEFGTKSPQSIDGTTFYLYTYVQDVDKAAAQAKGAGAKVEGPHDMFWGDRVAIVTDPSGHVWTVATHTRDVSPEEMAAAMKKMSGAKPGDKAKN